MDQLISAHDAIRFGLNYEKMRLEAASYNLAIANVVIQGNSENPTMSVSVDSSSFANSLGLPQISKQENKAPKQVHDPSNPFANDQGFVFYPNVDPTSEMITLVSATRAYEANVRAFNTMYQMSSKALEIGSGR